MDRTTTPRWQPPVHHALGGFEAVQSARLHKVLLAILGVLLGLALMYGFLGKSRLALSLVVMALLLLPSHELNRRHRVRSAADWLLWVLTLAIGGLALMGQGLRDSALLAYPGLLVFAIMLWRNRTMVLLLMGQVVLVGVLWWLDATGIYRSNVAAAGATQVLDIVATVGLTAYASWLIATDQRKYLSALSLENSRVSQALRQLEHSVRHDVLTGLPNRRAANEALQVLCDTKAAAAGAEAAVLLVNLDHFKSINESLGPQVGDDFLAILSQRMTGMLLEREQLFRTGSDEFLVIVYGVSDAAAASHRAEQWLTMVAGAINLSGVDISITASIGLALFPADGATPRELLVHADASMQRAKHAGRNTVRRFDGHTGNEGDHLKMLANMRKALLDGAFELHYQPKFDLHTGALSGAEALLRWKHPDWGQVSPATFIPLAEKSGLITDLGTWVIQSACRQMQHWLAAGCVVPPVAVNVSMVQFRRGNLHDVVRGALAASGLAGTMLELELTESLLSDSHGVVQATLKDIREAGVSLAIDDFGTGYSNLGYLRQFEIQTLKIDQSFVRRLETVPDDQVIVKAIVNIASQMGLKTVAEGVETASVAETLRQLGCDVGQGYLWSPALSAEHFERRYLVASQSTFMEARA